MRILIVSVLIAFFSSANCQNVIDSNHVYNGNSKHLVGILKGTILKPNLENGNDLQDRSFDLIDTLFIELKTDSLSYITEYDSSKMYWNIVGHQVEKRKNYIAFVLTITDQLASDFYDIAVGGLYDFGGPYEPTKNWSKNGFRYYFVLDISTSKIIYYHNPMQGVTISHLQE